MTGRAAYLPAAAVAFYLAWTALTWWFEGRILTLRRPEAVADRMIYALGVNLALGVVAATAALALLARGVEQRAAAGFGPGRPSPALVAGGFLAGFAAYATLGAPSLDPVVILNAYAQVLVVSAAEVVVCWSLPFAAAAATWPGGGRLRDAAAVLVSAAIFGLYHFAHSPPFDTWGMVGFLSVVGVVTGAVFAGTRDVYATLLFHNWLGTLGVARALADGGALDAMESPRPALIATGAVALAALAAVDAVLLRRKGPEGR